MYRPGYPVPPDVPIQLTGCRMFADFLNQVPPTHSGEPSPTIIPGAFITDSFSSSIAYFRYHCRPEAGLEYANHALEELSGYCIADFYDNPDLIFEMILPEDRDLVRASLGGANPNHPVSVRWIHAGGSSVPVELLIYPIYNQDGSLINLEGTARRQNQESLMPQTQSPMIDYRQQLLEIARRMAGNFSIEEVLGHIFDTLDGLLQYESCRIVVHSGQERLAEILHGVIAGSSSRKIHLQVSSNPREVVTGILRLPGSESQEAVEELSVRLRSGGDVFGSVHLTRIAAVPFTEQELELAHLCLFYASVAFENAILVTAHAGQNQVARQLFPSQDELIHPFTLEEVGELIGREALDITRLDAVSVMSVSQTGALKVRYSSGVSPAYLAHIALDQASMVEGEAIDHPQIQFVTDMEALGEDEPARLLAEAEGFRSMVVCPLVTRGSVIALVNCYGARPRVWTAEDASLLDLFVRQSGVVYANTLLYTDLEETYTQTVLTLSRAIDARDIYTGRHSQRLADWAERTARRLQCSEDEVRVIRWAALLHDIGKIGVPDAVLCKAGPLNESEWEIMRRHPITGAEIVSPFKKLNDISPIIRWHQEKFDGSGYPDGLRGEEIPLAARILTVVDAFGAMTDDRVYRKALSREEAVAELVRCSGTHFDSQVVQEFFEVLKASSPAPLPG